MPSVSHQLCRRFLLVALLGVSLGACNKSSKDGFVDDPGAGQEQGLLEKTFGDVQTIADQAARDGSLSTYRTQGGAILSGCATILHDSTTPVRHITIDFGSSNCLCRDGMYRRGKVIVTYRGRYRDVGSTDTITFANYFVNDNQVSGSKTVTNMGFNAAGQPVFDVRVNGGLILANSAGTISWQATRTRTWTQGYQTAGWSDDVYEVTGIGSLTRANGTVWGMNINTPLEVALDCRWIRKGTITFSPAGASPRVLDYGNGACDALATWTVNGQTRNITLR